MRKRRLPIPQHEFGFAADAFNLFQETALDGERIARERAALTCAQEQADRAQTNLFARRQDQPMQTAA